MKLLRIPLLLSLFILSAIAVHAQQGQTSDKVSIEELQNAEKLNDIVESEYLTGTVESYTVSIKKDGSIHIITNEGNYFKEDLREEMQKISRDDIVWIDDIKVTQKITMNASFIVTE